MLDKGRLSMKQSSLSHTNVTVGLCFKVLTCALQKADLESKSAGRITCCGHVAGGGVSSSSNSSGNSSTTNVVQYVCILLFALAETTPAGNFILNYIFLRTRDNEATELILQKYKLNNMLAASVKIVSAFFHDICL